MKLADWGSQKIHCSIDDTLWIFKDITEHKEYVSIFENPILKTMKKLHLKFGGGLPAIAFIMHGIILHLLIPQNGLQKKLKKMQIGLNLDFMDMDLMYREMTERMNLLIVLN